MRKVKEHFHKKQGIFRRVFSLILVLAMIMTMIPSIGGNLNVKAASTPMNVTIHFMEPSTWGWKQPAVQFWGNSKEIQMAAKIIILLSKQMQQDFSS